MVVACASFFFVSLKLVVRGPVASVGPAASAPGPLGWGLCGGSGGAGPGGLAVARCEVIPVGFWHFEIPKVGLVGVSI